MIRTKHVEIHDLFLGNPNANETLLFSGADSQYNFTKNLKSRKEYWYYKDTPIYYSYNENGHRCKNISEIDLSNYILFVGCSHTEGIGVELEKSYPYLVAEELGCDYYNLGVGGSGADTAFYNLMIWFNKIQHKPKHLVIQWPEPHRFITSLDENSYHLHGPWTTDEETLKFLYYGEELSYFTNRIMMYNNVMSTIINSDEIVYVNRPCDKKIFGEKHVLMEYRDLARDLVHFGIDTHKSIAKKIIAKI